MHRHLHRMMRTMNARVAVRTTVTIDDELVSRAMELTGVKERSAIPREGLQALIRIESARRLAALGGSAPAAEAAPRRRMPA